MFTNGLACDIAYQDPNQHCGTGTHSTKVKIRHGIKVLYAPN